MIPQHLLDSLQWRGLSEDEVLRSRALYGSNSMPQKRRFPLLEAVWSLLREPMVLLLLAAVALYAFSGSTAEAIFMGVAIGLVSAISLFQDSRSRSALRQLAELTQPKCTVIREGEAREIPVSEVVQGDLLVADEGAAIAADGIVRYAHDFRVNESLLTGESLPVAKEVAPEIDVPKTDAPDGHTPEHFRIYRGTAVSGGLAIAEVSAVGVNTRLGVIGTGLENMERERTPLEGQIHHFVRYMVLAGAAVFVLVWVLQFLRTGQVLDSLLKALTLAMSVLPEEIPVALTTFLALGARRLMRVGIIVRNMKTVETLGSATVICTDKTGTITRNEMELAALYLPSVHQIADYTANLSEEAAALVRMAMWASEPIPFDPMETALHQAYGRSAERDERPEYKLVHEYPIGGHPPMMTHIFQRSDGRRIIAAKGAPEALLAVSDIPPEARSATEKGLQSLTERGFRVLGVGEAVDPGMPFPEQQQDFRFHFCGLVAFYDPPKANMEQVFQNFYRAGLEVNLLTGDNDQTSRTIARQVGLVGMENSLQGEAVMALSDAALQEKVRTIRLYTRVFPEAKWRIVKALKANGAVVAMVGDGVNDSLALQSAHIGIAMGRKGTELAKSAASLILQRDDLAAMLDAIAMGRRIYANLKKAIRYIISIHIPIILTVFLPLALGWIYPDIFSPLHIIFLELIMGPTCSIIYENEPIEPNAMRQAPRSLSTSLFNRRELAVSLVQGLVITAGILFMYRWSVGQDYPETLVRSAVFTTLVSANIGLTLVNRSFHYAIWDTLRYANRLMVGIIGLTILLTGALLFLPPLARFFAFAAPPWSVLGMSVLVGLLSVLWFEGWKYGSRRQLKNRTVVKDQA